MEGEGVGKSEDPSIPEPAQNDLVSPGQTIMGPPPPVTPKKHTYFNLYRYVEGTDWIVLFLGFLCALCSGFCIPLMTWQFGTVTNRMVILGIMGSPDYGRVFASRNKTPFCLKLDPNVESLPSNPSKTPGLIVQFINNYALVHALFALALTALSSAYFLAWYWVGERQIHRLTLAYFEALLRKDSTWLDTKTNRDFANDLIQKICGIRAGIGEGVGMTVGFTSVLLLSLFTAFWHSWELSLVSFTAIPVLGMMTWIVASVEAKAILAEAIEGGRVGGLVEDVLLNIRTVLVYQGQVKEFREFSARVQEGNARKLRHNLVFSLTTALVWLIEYGTNGLCYWYGTGLVLRDRAGCRPGTPAFMPGNLIIIGDSMFFAAIHIVLAFPRLQSIFEAHQCAKEVFSTIDTKSSIDSMSTEGIIPGLKAVGRFQFSDVVFSYPARPDMPILKGVSFSVEPGLTVAICGRSGSGKSTILKLLSKEYFQDRGSIKLDGVELREINLSWLRGQMSVVTQDSGLFDTTIEENVRMGRPDATYAEVVNACRAANAHEFIIRQPEEYSTEIGFQGNRLSGGERQRIAIARALIRRPQVLLLDEITSALDFRSEAVVQEAIQKVSKGRTTFIIAHRLHTIASSDLIIVFESGQIAEQGTHAELLKADGVYASLIREERQNQSQLVSRSRRSTNPVLDPVRSLRNRSGSVSLFPIFSGNKRLSRESFSHFKQYGQHGSSAEMGESAAKVPSVLFRAWNERKGSSLDGPKRSALVLWNKFLDLEDKDSGLEAESRKKVGSCSVLGLVSMGCILLFWGVVASVTIGSLLPLYGIVFGGLVEELSNLNEREARRRCGVYSLTLALAGLMAFLGVFTQSLTLTLAGTRAVNYVRERLFFRILRMDLGWFDRPANKEATLMQRLGNDASCLACVVTTAYGVLCQSFVSLLVGIGIPLYIAPRLTLYSLGLVPIVLVASFLNGWLAKVQERKASETMDEISRLVLDVFQNKHVVTTCQLETYFIQKLKTSLDESGKSGWVVAVGRALAFGVSQAAAFWTYSIFMYMGGREITAKRTKFSDVLKVGDTLIFGLLFVGGSLTVLPSFMKSIAAGKRILVILRQKAALDYDTGGRIIDHCAGEIEFEDVEFAYPAKPERRVLKGISFTAQPNQLLALVGSSGSGKTTCLQLILRFYDVTRGSLTLDGVELKRLNCASLRSHMALIPQTPRLFDRTLAQNIAYGDNGRDEVPMEEIKAAAVAANIHTFIRSLPEGYSTLVGNAGSFLSGGQLQKIAIARALLKPDRNILILDEATSALDNESERAVMEAIEKAREGRTCIAIAHRLLSIKDADTILVLDRGRIIQAGTHEQLIAKQGLYAKLWKAQNVPEDPGDHAGSKVSVPKA